MKQLFFLSLLAISLNSQMRRLNPNTPGLLGSNQNQVNGQRSGLFDRSQSRLNAFNRNQNNRELSQYRHQSVFLFLSDVKSERSNNIKRTCTY